MFLIIMILSIPVSGQVSFNDFDTDLKLGLAAPEYDEMLGHFDILPELVVTAPRIEADEPSQAYLVLDTVEVVANRYAPAADYQFSRGDYGSTTPNFLRYASYVILSIIAALMLAVIPVWVGKSPVYSKPQAVPLQRVPWKSRRKKQCKSMFEEK